MAFSIIERAKGFCGELARDRSGLVLPYVTVLLTFIVAGSVIALDGSRYVDLQTQLQKGADAFALAAAAELDRRPTAITRADNALATLVQDNSHVFGEGGGNVTVSGRRYLSSLPANDTDPITAANETNDPTEARFVEVTVAPEQLRTIIPASFFGGANTVTTSAQAVAGFDAAVCKFTPVFICNPYEGTGTSIFDAALDPDFRRRQIELRASTSQAGGDAKYFPGNFGFLQPPDGRGADALRDSIAQVNPEACFLQNAVDLKTGFIASTRHAFNVRFDIYEGNYNSKNGEAAFRPARNVRKGYVPKNAKNPNYCNMERQDPQTTVMGMPRDGVMGNLGNGNGGRLGNGMWNAEGYWTTNHPGKPLPTINGEVVSNADPPSRYSMYRHEIDQSILEDASAGGEKGAPRCSTAPVSDTPDRRVIFGAVLNCQELDAQYNLQGQVSGLPVLSFAKFFLTEPVEQASESSVFVELIELIEPGGTNDEVARDIVQLYR